MGFQIRDWKDLPGTLAPWKSADPAFMALTAIRCECLSSTGQPGADTRFAEQNGQIKREHGKIVSAEITIGAGITLSDLTVRAVDWVIARVKGAKDRHAEGEKVFSVEQWLQVQQRE